MNEACREKRVEDKKRNKMKITLFPYTYINGVGKKAMRGKKRNKKNKKKTDRMVESSSELMGTRVDEAVNGLSIAIRSAEKRKYIYFLAHVHSISRYFLHSLYRCIYKPVERGAAAAV